METGAHDTFPVGTKKADHVVSDMLLMLGIPKMLINDSLDNPAVQDEPSESVRLSGSPPLMTSCTSCR